MKSEDEIYEQIEKAMEVSSSSGSAYIDGVLAALDWVMGRVEDAPMDDDQ